MACLDGASGQAVELVDGHEWLHVGKLWWRDHLRMNTPLKIATSERCRANSQGQNTLAC